MLLGRDFRDFRDLRFSGAGYRKARMRLPLTLFDEEEYLPQKLGKESFL